MVSKRFLSTGLLAVFLVFCAAASGPAAEPRPDEWAVPVKLEHSDNFFRVTPDLYRSAQPTAEAMRAYAKFGIRTVINLRGFHDDNDEAAGTGLTLVHIPIHTWQAGDEATMIRVLQAIRDAEKPVLVHCQHGADRTGLVMAMFRMVEQGWSREEALREMREGGYGFHSIWTNIPDYIASANLEKVRAALR